MSIVENRMELSRRRCDERRLYLVGLESLAERLRGDAIRLRQRVERATAAEYAVSSQPFIERHDKIERSIAEIEAQIAAARAALDAAEQELKRRERDRAHQALGNDQDEELASRRPRRRRRA